MQKSKMTNQFMFGEKVREKSMEVTSRASQRSHENCSQIYNQASPTHTYTHEKPSRVHETEENQLDFIHLFSSHFSIFWY